MYIHGERERKNVCMYVYIYIYTCTERDRERESERKREYVYIKYDLQAAWEQTAHGPLPAGVILITCMGGIYVYHVCRLCCPHISLTKHRCFYKGGNRASV